MSLHMNVCSRLFFARLNNFSTPVGFSHPWKLKALEIYIFSFRIEHGICGMLKCFRYKFISRLLKISLFFLFHFKLPI